MPTAVAVAPMRSSPRPGGSKALSALQTTRKEASLESLMVRHGLSRSITLAERAAGCTWSHGGSDGAPNSSLGDPWEQGMCA